MCAARHDYDRPATLMRRWWCESRLWMGNIIRLRFGWNNSQVLPSFMALPSDAIEIMIQPGSINIFLRSFNFVVFLISQVLVCSVWHHFDATHEYFDCQPQQSIESRSGCAINTQTHIFTTHRCRQMKYNKKKEQMSVYDAPSLHCYIMFHLVRTRASIALVLAPD